MRFIDVYKMPRTYLKPGTTGSSGGAKSNNEAKSDFDKLSIKPGKRKGKENRLFDVSDDSIDSDSRISRGKIKATSNFTRLGEDSPGSSSNSFVYENKDDTFDKLFVNVDSAKVRVPSVPMDVSAAEHNSNQESANDSGNCWGLFKSFHEKDLPDGQNAAGTNQNQSENPKLPDFILQPLPENIDYPALKTATAPKRGMKKNAQPFSEISSLANLPAATSEQVFLDVFQSPLAGGSDLSSRVPDPAAGSQSPPSVLVINDDSIQRNDAMNKNKKKIFSPATFFNHTPGATKSKKTVSCLTSTPVLSVSRYSVTTPQTGDYGKMVKSSLAGSQNRHENLEDDVFMSSTTKGSNEKRHLGIPGSSRLQALSSNEMIPATPESFVNPARGRKNYGGPVLSVMQHYNFKPSLVSPCPNLSRSKVIWSPGTSVLSANKLKSTAKGSNRTDSSSSQECQIISPDRTGTTGKETGSNRTGINSSQECHIISQDRTGTTEKTKLSGQKENRNTPPKYDAEYSVQEIDITKQKLENEEIEIDDDENKQEGDVEVLEGDDEGGEEEDFVLGCACGEYDVEDWLVMCDGCLQYFHALCIGMPVAYVELLAQPDPPEWFCNQCTENHKAYESVTGQSFVSDNKDLTKDISHHDVDNLSLMYVEEEEPEIVARPGKRWRKSIAVGLLSKDLETSGLLGRSRADFTSFAVPMLPKTDNNKRRTRKSIRISNMHELLEDDDVSFAVQPRANKCMKPVSSARPSFYVVPNYRLSDLSSRENSIVLETRRLTRPSFYISKIADQTTTCHEKTILIEEDISDIDKLLSQCTKQNVIAFEEVYGPDTLVNSKKVGEGAFGEVFLISSADSEERPVLKVVPIGGDLKVNEEDQTKIMDMMSEVVISRSLSNLRSGSSNKTTGFVEVRNCTVFQGNYPDKLLNLWDAFEDEKGSENTRPDFLPRDQLYIALEFNNGGQDLEKFVFRNASQALAAWKQVVHTLAVAETELEFEHRDLHWGNILIKETTAKSVDYIIDGVEYKVETSGIQTTIIDFSLSRLTSLTDSCTIYNNLAEDPTLFTAKGLDKGGDYQFDVYRLMKKENANDWEKFCSKTNIFWLHYILEKMITEVYYKGKTSSKIHKSGLSLLKNLKKNLLEYSSAKEWVVQEGSD